MSVMGTSSAVEILASIKRQAEETGVSEKELIRTYIKRLNQQHQAAFAAVPFTDRILLLPQCLRQPGCTAPQSKDGYHCQQCDPTCQVNKLSAAARRLGYKATFILPGGSMLPRVVSATHPRAVLGISCEEEALLGILTLERKGIIAYGTLLLRDGCYNTIVDLYTAILVLSLGDKLNR